MRWVRKTKAWFVKKWKDYWVWDKKTADKLDRWAKDHWN